MKRFRFLLYSTMVVASFFFLSEWFSHLYLKSKYKAGDIGLGNHIIFEYSQNFLRIKKDVFNLKKSVNLSIPNQKITVGSQAGMVEKKVPGKFSFEGKEGMIRNAGGDFVVNHLGFRGPYFDKKKEKNIYRIFILGGSTTAGDYQNELTFPRILERMLNDNSSNLVFEVINAGVWGNDSCDVEKFYFRDIVNLEPDLILIMSGWNDLNKFKDKKIKSKIDFCQTKSEYNYRFHSYRLLRELIVKYLPKPKVSIDFNDDFADKSFEIYLSNFENIIKDMNFKEKMVGLIGLTSALDNDSRVSEINKYPQIVQLDLSERDIVFQKRVGNKLNFLMKNLAKNHTNAFFINSSMSLNSKGKNLFIWDTIHPTGEGNRLLAYGVYKKINKNFKFRLGSEDPYEDEQKIGKNELEVEYIKSIFSSNNIEDLSYSGCLALHKKCTHVSSRNPYFEKVEYVNGINLFVLGSLIQFRRDCKDQELYELFKGWLSIAINKAPKNSLSYWVLSQLHYLNKENELGLKYEKIAIKKNPLLREISFSHLLRGYLKNHNTNLMVPNLKEFIYILKKSPNYISPYVSFYEYFYSTQNKNFSNNSMHLRSLYYSSPLLVRSIFAELLRSLIAQKNWGASALLLEHVTKTKPEYGNYFKKFQSQISQGKTQ